MRSVMIMAVSAYLWVLRLLVALIVAIVAVAVVFRYIFNAPLIFSFDLAVVLFVWLIFLGLARAAHEGAHLSVDMLTTMLPTRLASMVEVGMRLLMIAIALFIAIQAYDLTTRTRMEIATMRISMAWLYAAAPTGFALFALYETYALWRSLVGRPIARANGGIL
ncbi:MAG: TRAP transporter small permease subunit [Cupriavidus sp.]|nr:TRAP transporter small permease subunit [Cupriavidus sp.]MCA3704360.1 TRAP transporter small permease subunit [Methylobacterium sp.]MCA3774573.1 TRAP transporter small permease subunit [Cutibacterium sp.]